MDPIKIIVYLPEKAQNSDENKNVTRRLRMQAIRGTNGDSPKPNASVLVGPSSSISMDFQGVSEALYNALDGGKHYSFTIEEVAE